MEIAKDLGRRLSKNRLIHTLRSNFVYVSFAILACAVIYGAWYASADRSTNSDALIYPYLFSGHFWRDKIILASIHSNILKFPLFFLQSRLPYNYLTYTFVNYGLVLITALGTTFLIYKIFGKKPAIIANLALSFFVIVSSQLNLQLIYTTVRNIEYLVVFVFTLILLLIQHEGISNLRRVFVCAIVTLLYAILLAGDRLFLYTTALPLMVFFVATALRSRIMRNTLLPALLVALTIPLGYLINRGVDKVGFYNGDPGYQPAQNHLSWHTFWQSFYFAAKQLGNFVGINSWFHNVVISLIGGILIIGGVTGFLLALYAVFVRHNNRPKIHEQFAAIAGMLFLGTFFVYALSGLTFTLAGGNVIEVVDNDRYITLLPLLLCIGLAFAVAWWRWTAKQYYTVASTLLVALLIGSVLAFPKIESFRRQIAVRESSYKGLATVLSNEHVTALVGGFWYGGGTRFWSHNHIVTASVNTCNVAYPPNERTDWYRPTPAVKRSAYLIDPAGPDKIFFANCSETKLISILGLPDEIKLSPSYSAAEPLKVWIYNYDIRTHIVSQL